MRRRPPDDQTRAERHRALGHERLPAASQHDHPLLGVGMRVRVRDLVRREPLDRQVVVRALADRHPAEPRRAERDEVLGQHPEHPQVVQDLREVAHVVLGRLARTHLGRHVRSLPLLGAACIAAPVGRGLSSRPTEPQDGIREGTMTTELLIVGGERVPAAEEGTFTVIEPGNGSPMAEVAEAGPEDARRAVDVAVRAFEEGPWPRTSAHRTRPRAAPGLGPGAGAAGGARADRGSERGQADRRRAGTRSGSSRTRSSTGAARPTRSSARRCRSRTPGSTSRSANRSACAR